MKFNGVFWWSYRYFVVIVIFIFLMFVMLIFGFVFNG